MTLEDILQILSLAVVFVSLACLMVIFLNAAHYNWMVSDDVKMDQRRQQLEDTLERADHHQALREEMKYVLRKRRQQIDDR